MRWLYAYLAAFVLMVLAPSVGAIVITSALQRLKPATAKPAHCLTTEVALDRSLCAEL